ncbi:MAG: metalloregulator ArsR/SmtB family transcription factor [Candidatus Bathyarchaeota archaeon]|nr:metalloregulator ArsR/SmtB family transcription factor [Candidatus Bathyarchaeota archaeon]
MEIPPSLRDSFEEIGGITGIRERTPKQEDIVRSSRVFHILSDPRRLRIILILSVQSSCVCILKRLIRMSDSKLSYHLSVLKKNGLVRTTREGNWIVYALTDKGKTLLPIIRGG